ncbi:palmitoyltransferase ZDHHC1-like isoform X3 [Hypanus sabinus]|uniref:palmitoyltransferase ZDHHC1-like isoform X3 n=1 Tax=Hypanus sabinus TaxID=79690 RepID=UPI0028C3C078|nr:palmitoyltransferase ZDHHC1-like isoform X3 [Hypanus sabinus]
MSSRAGLVATLVHYIYNTVPNMRSSDQMDCFRNRHKTEPEENRRSQRRYTPSRPKVNGWSWPPHPFQILSWIADLYFLIVVVGILIPLLPSGCVPAGYVWFGGAFIWNVAFQVIAVTIDPAEDSVRAKGYKRLPPVYKGKPLKSGLRERYCPLCELQVYFLGCVISAVLCCLIVVTISGFVFVGFFINPKLLQSSPEFGLINDADTWHVFLPYFSVRTNFSTILVLAVVTVGLSLTALIVLCDLLFFHFYLMWKQISTYEYILFSRERRVSKVSPQSDDIEALRLKSNQNAENVATHQNGNTHVHFESTSTNGSTSGYHQDAVMIEDETLPTVASDRSQARIKRISQKAAIRTTKRPFRPSQLPPALAAAIRSSVLSLQSFPSMDYLSALSASTVRSVQAAGSPAEYRSDSAESG